MQLLLRSLTKTGIAEDSRITIAEYVHKSITKWLKCQSQRSAFLFNSLATFNNLILLVVSQQKQVKY